MEHLGKKLLIAGDAQLNRAVQSELFCNQFEVLCASGSKEALTSINQHRDKPLDLVILDMDSFEAIT